MDTVWLYGSLVLAQALILHVFLKALMRKRYTRSLVRALLCVILAQGLHLLIAGSVLRPVFDLYQPTVTAVAGSLALLFLCAFPLVRYIMRPGLILTTLTCLLLLASSFGLRQGVQHFSPESDLAAVLSMEEPALTIDQLKENTNIVQAVEQITEGVDAYDQLNQDASLADDFKRGFNLFKERKEWMDSLSLEEKQAYRAEMKSFLAEQGLAEDPSSLAAIRSANVTNVADFASLFDEMEKMSGATAQERTARLNTSLEALKANTKGMTGADCQKLKQVSELLAQKDNQGAIRELKEQLKTSNGNNSMAGSMLAALMQSVGDIPVDSLMADSEGKSFFDFKGLFGRKKEPEPEENPAAEPVAAQTSLVDAVVTEEETEISEQTHIPISARLGVVHVPSDERTLGEWIKTVHQLSVEGFASLGGKTAILLKDGTMYTSGDVWQMEYAGFQYRFSIDKVTNNRVYLTGLSRTEAFDSDFISIHASGNAL